METYTPQYGDATDYGKVMKRKKAAAVAAYYGGGGTIVADVEGEREVQDVTAKNVYRSVSVAWIWMILIVAGVVVSAAIVGVVLGMDYELRSAMAEIKVKRTAHEAELGLPGCEYHAGKLSGDSAYLQKARRSDRTKCIEAEVYLSQWPVVQYTKLFIGKYVDPQAFMGYIIPVLWAIPSLTTGLGVIKAVFFR